MRTTDGIRDPVWQFIGTVIGIIALLASIFFYVQSQQLKSLQIVFLANVSAVVIDDVVENKIQINYEDKKVDNLSLLTVKVKNIGNQSIRPEDYVEPILFSFPEQSEIIESSVITSIPENIDLKATVVKNTATLSTSLLNAGDEVIVRFVVINVPRNNNDYPKVKARIADVRKLEVVTVSEISRDFRQRVNRFLRSPLVTLLATTTVILIGIGGLLGRISWPRATLIIIQIAIIFGILFLSQ